MEEITKINVDWKKIVVVGLLVVLTGLVSGGGTWYVMDTFKDNELEVKDNEIATLNTRISELEAELSGKGETTTGSTSNIFDISTVKVGDKIAGLTVSKIESCVKNSDLPIGKENICISFTGRLTLTGSYDYPGSTSEFLNGDYIVFTPDAASAKLIPNIAGRTSTIQLTNLDKAKELFGITTGTAKKGTATITVSGYRFAIYPSEVTDTAEIVSKN